MADSGFFKKDVFISYNVKNEIQKKPFRFPKTMIKGFLGLIILTLALFLGIRVVSLMQVQLQKNPLTHGKTEQEIQVLYFPILEQIKVSRETLSQIYAQATNSVKKKEVERKAQNTLYNALQASIFPYWIGTDWSFEGMTETPGTGSVACGYFVATTLRDAGLNLERISLAQQASENIIQTLNNEEYITRYSNTGIDDFLVSVGKKGYGIYIVGLDKHIGFLQYNKEGMFFIHSTYMDPFGVVKEPATSSYALVNSKYRVLGDLLGDTGLVKKWLTQEKFVTVK